MKPPLWRALLCCPEPPIRNCWECHRRTALSPRPAVGPQGDHTPSQGLPTQRLINESDQRPRSERSFFPRSEVVFGTSAGLTELVHWDCRAVQLPQPPQASLPASQAQVLTPRALLNKLLTSTSESAFWEPNLGCPSPQRTLVIGLYILVLAL